MLRNYIKFFIRFFHFCCYVFLCLTVGTSCWFVQNVLYCQIVRQRIGSSPSIFIDTSSVCCVCQMYCSVHVFKSVYMPTGSLNLQLFVLLLSQFSQYPWATTMGNCPLSILGKYEIQFLMFVVSTFLLTFDSAVT